MRQPLCCSSANAGIWGERLWWWFHPLHVTQQYHLASMAARLSSKGILHRYILSHPLDPSLHSQKQPSPWDCSTIPKRQLPAAMPSRGSASLSGVCLAAPRTVCVLIPFRLLQISCFTLSLKCFSSDSDNCPDVGIRPLLQVPHPPRAGPVLLTPPFPPSSFILPSFAWVYIFFSAGQALLSTQLAFCMHFSVWRCILMHQWREMNSMSTYSSAMLFSTNQSNFNGLNNASLLSYRSEVLKPYCWQGCISFGKFRREFIFLPFLPSRSHLHPARNPYLSPSSKPVAKYLPISHSLISASI